MTQREKTISRLAEICDYFLATNPNLKGGRNPYRDADDPMNDPDYREGLREVEEYLKEGE